MLFVWAMRPRQRGKSNRQLFKSFFLIDGPCNHVGYYHVYMDRLTSIKLVKYYVQLQQQQKTLLHVGSQLLNYNRMFLILLS